MNPLQVCDRNSPLLLPRLVPRNFQYLLRYAEEYLAVMTIVYEQQNIMHQTKTKSIPNRIVNLHQWYVRPIVRGKEGKKVEVGSKLQVSLSNGYTFLDKLSWENFNEGTCLISSVENYKNRFGYYPAEVLADKIYCTRDNRRRLKEFQIELRAKPTWTT